MTTKERLDLIIRSLGLSGRAFEKACGLANGSYASIGDGVGADKLKKIIIAFPQISAEWVLTGRGEMFKTPDGYCSAPALSRTDDRQDKPTTKEKMSGALSQMAGIVSGHQHDLSRLITEIERNGERSDRILHMIEHQMGIFTGGASKKNYNY